MADKTFVTVDALRPDTKGVNLTVKVVDAKVVLDRARGPKGGLRVSECLVGDQTGIIVLTAKNEQVDVAVKDATLTLTNAKVELFRGSMRLAIESNGSIETSEQDVKPNVSNNLSLLEFELVTLPSAQ